ncbi:hypothetical protein [Pseudomonas sp. NPDC088444]|uniref:hypothetical protein n=1 Tax=Pseudomonas sp. NPDC088444 TaxID=3364456 RepID=UPI00384D4A88
MLAKVVHLGRMSWLTRCFRQQAGSHKSMDICKHATIQICHVQPLWKTIPKSFQTATVSRCKRLFCHGFDLSSFAVEATVNKLVAVGYSPLFTWLVEVWLIFDQRFWSLPLLCLSTLQGLFLYTVNSVRKPVDNSVRNPWKDGCRSRNL